MKYISNAFSTKMVEGDAVILSIRPLRRIEDVISAAEGAVSCVGHADTAAVFSAVLGLPVMYSREHVTLAPGDQVLVGEIRNPDGGSLRLPEKTAELPTSYSIKWKLVTVASNPERSHCANCGAVMVAGELYYNLYGGLRCPDCGSCEVITD